MINVADLLECTYGEIRPHFNIFNCLHPVTSDFLRTRSWIEMWASMKDTVIRVLLVSHVLLCFPLINRKDTVFSLSNYVGYLKFTLIDVSYFHLHSGNHPQRIQGNRCSKKIRSYCCTKHPSCSCALLFHIRQYLKRCIFLKGHQPLTIGSIQTEGCKYVMPNFSLY